MMSYEAAQSIAEVVPDTLVTSAGHSSNYFIVFNRHRSSFDVDSLIKELNTGWIEDSAAFQTSNDTIVGEDEGQADLQSNYDTFEKKIYDDWSDDSNLDWSVSFDDRGPGDWEDMIEDPSEYNQEVDWRGIDVSEEWADPHFGLDH